MIKQKALPFSQCNYVSAAFYFKGTLTPTTDLLPHTLPSSITGPLELLICQPHQVQTGLAFPIYTMTLLQISLFANPIDVWPLLPAPHQCSTRNITEGNGKSNTDLALFLDSSWLFTYQSSQRYKLVEAIKGRFLIQAGTSCKFLAIHLPSLRLSLLICKTGTISSVSKRFSEDSMT